MKSKTRKYVRNSMGLKALTYRKLPLKSPCLNIVPDLLWLVWKRLSFLVRL